MSEDYVTAIQGAVATFTFNRPISLNALTIGMIDGMRTFFAQVENDPAIRCVVINAAGDHFMAGGDVKSFVELLQAPKEQRRIEFEQFIHRLQPVIMLMRRMRKPVIASVQGAAAGFGLSLALACDLVIAADTAYFAMAYVKIGTTPDGSGSYFLPRLVGLKKAMEIALLGDRFDAATAREIGLINFVVPADRLAAETGALAQRLAEGPAHAIGNTKELLNASLDRSLEAQLQAEAVSFAECAATDDMLEGAMAFAQKRKPKFTGR